MRDHSLPAGGLLDLKARVEGGRGGECVGGLLAFF